MSDYVEKSILPSGGGELIINTAINSYDSYDVGTYTPGKAGYITFTAQELHGLADWIKENIPEPSPLGDARFIMATPEHTSVFERVALAKIDGFWYDRDGTGYTESEVLDLYTEIGVIR